MRQPANANWPRSTFLNRASVPFFCSSRRMAADHRPWANVPEEASGRCWRELCVRMGSSGG